MKKAKIIALCLLTLALVVFLVSCGGEKTPSVTEPSVTEAPEVTEVTEVTDLSDAPKEIKEKIMENAEKLEMREKEPKQETVFEPVRLLRRMADERNILANIGPNGKRFEEEALALEYAVSVLEALAI